MTDSLRPGNLIRQTLLLFSGMLCLLILTHSGFDNSEANYHYLISQQILQRGVLSFETPHEGPFVVAPNGRTYAAHELGNSLALLPVALANGALERAASARLGNAKVALGARFLFAMMGPFFCAAASAFLFMTLRLIFLQPARTAAFGVLSFCFCSFYWTYSRSIFDGVLCSVLLSATMFFLFYYARHRGRWDALAAALFCIGFGIITRLSMVLVALAALAYLVSILRHESALRIKQVACICAITLGPFLAWQLYYNHLRTGQMFISPGMTAKYASEIGLTGNIWTGAAGLLFSPGKSIFIYCSAALLSLFLFRRFQFRYRHEAIFVGVLCIFWLILHARLQSWYGSWGWGPRHFVTIVPALLLPFLAVRPEVQSRAFRWVTALLLSFGFTLAAASIITNYHYRLGLAAAEHRNSDSLLVWSVQSNQAVDVLGAAGRNVRRIIFGGDYEVLPNASKIDVIGSNTLNLWLVTGHLSGVPVGVLAAAGVFLAAVSGFSFWPLLRHPKTIRDDP